MKPKKKNQAKIVKPNSVNYTFIDIVISQIESKKPQKKKDKKINKFTKKTLKDSKTHYKFNSRSPKSQQGHSPVYE